MRSVKFNHLPSIFSAALCAGLLLNSPASFAADSSQDTAQQLLFDNPYLENIALPSKLTYTFTHSSAKAKEFGEDFSGEINLEVKKPEQSKAFNQVHVDMFTGPRRRSLGPLNNVRGNPIIMVFLERDAWNMKRRVGGTPAFYRNSIRKAMRDAAPAEKIKITLDGAALPAKKITIKPFANAPVSEKFAEFRKKVYEFTVAADVPGGIYEIRSLVPGAGKEEKALVEEKLVFMERTDGQ